jgi:hypothetical protein
MCSVRNTTTLDKVQKLSNSKWNMPLEFTFENISLFGIIISEYSNSIETSSYKIVPQKYICILDK